jgi:hypothetical protein
MQASRFTDVRDERSSSGRVMRNAGCRDLPESREQPGDLIQPQEEVCRYDAERDEAAA